MPNCILCTSQFSFSRKPEHILLNALGGRKTVRGIICDKCNNATGSAIDRHLAKSIETVRAYAGFTAGDGDSPPKLRNLGRLGAKFDVVDGIPRLRPTPGIELINHENGSHTISLKARDFDHLLELVEQAISRCKFSGHLAEKFRNDVLAGSFAHHIPTPIEDINLSLGERLSLRSMAKSILILLASQIGSEAVLHRHFDGTREFIMNDADTIEVAINSNRLPSFTQAYGSTPNIVWTGSDQNGVVFGYFNLYGIVGWTFTLSAHSSASIQPSVIVNNPSEPKSWTDDRNVAELLSVDWVKDTKFDDADLKRGLSSLHTRMHEFSRGRLIEKSISDELSKTNFDQTGYLDPSETQRVLGGLAYRVGMGLFRLPWSEPSEKSSDNRS